MAQAHKDPASRRGSSGSTHGGARAVGLANAEGPEDGVKAVSGIVQLMSNLHHNAAAVVTSKVKQLDNFSVFIIQDFIFYRLSYNMSNQMKFVFRQILMVRISFCHMMSITPP